MNDQFGDDVEKPIQTLDIDAHQRRDTEPCLEYFGCGIGHSLDRRDFLGCHICLSNHSS